MKARPYQLEAIAAAHDEFLRVDSTLIVLPTGLGKTVIFSMIANEWVSGRVLVIAPQLELIEQARQKLLKVTGILPDIEQGRHFSNAANWGQSPYVVASKQSLATTYTDRWGVKQKRYTRLTDIGLVVVDEAHYSLTEQYKEIIDHFRRLGAKVLGLTATPKRKDKKAMGQMYETNAYTMTIADAIDGGWLVSPKTHCLKVESLDLSHVDTSGGDFSRKQLGKALEVDKVIYEIAELTAAESRGLKTVVYCESVEQCRQVSILLSEQHGYKAEWVCGDAVKCPESKRERVLSSFANDPDGVQIVCNVGVLTTGWDCPTLEHIVMARPTKSLSLYTQIMGRGTRPLEGVVDFEGSTPNSRRAAIAASRKPYFKVTDLRDNSLEHKLISCVDVLGGEMGLEQDVRERAKEMLAAPGGEARPLGEVLEAAIAAQAEADRRERERLKSKRAKATYHSVEVDPFSAGKKGKKSTTPAAERRLKFGKKYKGELMSEIPADYLRWVCGSDLPMACKGPCMAELSRRKKAKAAGNAPSQPSEVARIAAQLSQLLLEM